ncbi:MAG: hypothetical protein Q7K41_06865, partial [Dehalococcoidales bacterium]|nr:hypothetical protein [Dehalococcoidales bacterium]
MNTKISKILGVGMTIAMLASLLVMATPASASALGWGEDTALKNLKQNVDTANRALNNTDINEVAVNGQTIYATTADAQTLTLNAVYKSTDGGATWGTLRNSTDYPTTKTISRVAVSPDDAKSVAILATDSTVYYSSDGGSTWQNAGIPGTTGVITDIDVSAGASKYIAAGGAISSVAELWILKASGGLGTGWDARYSTANGAINTQTNIFAVQFSRNYSSDKVVTVVSSNGTLEANFQVFRNDDVTASLRKWNGSINSSYTDAGWGTNAGVALVTTGSTLVAASIALVPTYLGSDAGTLDAFIGVAAASAAQGNVYHIAADTTKTTLTVAGGSGSVAYNASKGILVAGSWTSTRVNRWLNPLATSPTKESIATLQQPSGVNHTVVAWVGDNVVAGTAGDNSAFGTSTDNGKTFNDVSMIDTSLSSISDVALNAAGTKIYMTSNDSSNVTAVSVWLKSTTWNRILTMASTGSPAYAGGTKLLVRIAPENDAVVYVAAQGTASTTNDNMWVSKDSGTTWTTITNSKLASVQDFVVQNATTVYAIDTTGALSKSTDSGASWGDKVNASTAAAGDGWMVTLAPNNDVLMAGTTGYVTFSKDAGATLTRTQISVANTNGVVVVADKDYATNNTFYVGTGATVYRGKADATSAMASRSPSFDATYTTPYITGLVSDNGTIYAVSTNGTVSALSSALNLTSTVDSSTNALWSTVIHSAATGLFGGTPQSLKLASGHVLWVVNTGTYSATSRTIESYTETNASDKPTMTAPATNYLVPVNVTTGRAYNVSFTFNRPALDTSGIATYVRLQIATDSAFGGIIYDYTFTDIDETTETRIIGPNGVTNQAVEFMPNTTYYWRTKVAGGTGLTSPTLQSLWSETRTLKVDKTAPAVAP